MSGSAPATEEMRNGGFFNTNSTDLVSDVVAEISTEKSEVVVIPVHQGRILPQLSSSYSNHLLRFLGLPVAFRRRLGGSLCGRQLFRLNNLRGFYQLHHLLGFQLYLIRSDLNEMNIY